VGKKSRFCRCCNYIVGYSLFGSQNQSFKLDPHAPFAYNPINDHGIMQFIEIMTFLIAQVRCCPRGWRFVAKLNPSSGNARMRLMPLRLPVGLWHAWSFFSIERYTDKCDIPIAAEADTVRWSYVGSP
jgi:hypothetical protein